MGHLDVGHLNDDQLTEYLLGEAQAATAQHLQSCAECSSEAERVKRSLHSFKAWTHEQAVVQEPKLNVFSLASRVENRSFTLWFSWSAVLALIVIAFALMITPAKSPAPEVVQSSSQPDADDALLMEVQQDLDRNVPQALAPAALLAAERNRVIEESRVRNQ
jgi:hypothetical protein